MTRRLREVIPSIARLSTNTRPLKASEQGQLDFMPNRELAASREAVNFPYAQMSSFIAGSRILSKSYEFGTRQCFGSWPLDQTWRSATAAIGGYRQA
jgi:hypothetical protein